MKLSRLALGWILICVSIGAGAQTQDTSPEKYRLQLETGYVTQGANRVQVPNNLSGTRFGLNSLIGDGGSAYFRANLLTTPQAKWGWRAVYAPLTLSGTGTLSQTTAFDGTNFAANTPTRGSYQFNSYRVSYWKRFHQDARSTWRAGITLKIRDARISLRQGNTVESKYDLGFVPLLHISGEYKITPRWTFLLDFDGLAGGPGRAFDLGLQIAYDVDKNWMLFGGYRTLEGGADVDSVYNFAWLNYASVGVGYRFR